MTRTAQAAKHGLKEPIPAMAGSPALWTVQKRIDRYRLEQLLAEGAMGKVFLATDPKLDRQVAIKLIGAEADEKARSRFQLEARSIAALKHPNIVALHDYSGESSDQLYLVMEYIPGKSLFELHARFGTMSEPTALCVGHELALALEHAHSHAVVHRDIKPENILLANGRIVLTDFGGVKVVARNRDGRGHSRTAALGTPGFMAPEQFEGKNIGPSTDVFGVGASLYNLTTGRIAYEGGSVDKTLKNLRSGRFVDPRTHQELLSPEFAKFLAKCLAARSADRLPNAARLRGAIRKLMAMHGIEEVREELQRYEESPATYAVAQRDRSVDVLLKELSEALRRRDYERANSLAERVKKLAPLDDRARQIAGIGPEAGVIRRHRDRAPQRTFWIGVLVGVTIGVLGTTILFVALGA